MLRNIGIWIITAIAVATAFYVVPGIGFVGSWPRLEAAPGILGSPLLLPTMVLAAILALINSFIKPIIRAVTLPITILTLGIFALVLNTLLLYLASWAGNTFFETNLYIEGFFSAFFAAIIISIVTVILGAITGLSRRPRNNRSCNEQE
ncbi:MAG: phage holin family protein [Actinomycetia bacterium]|nr:phage holin family protein [Actinomycetes bacterium]